MQEQNIQDQGMWVSLSKDDLIRIGQIQHELAAIDEGYTDMLDGNETITDRLLRLAYELLNILNNGIR